MSEIVNNKETHLLELHDRRHRIKAPKGFTGKWAIRLKDGFESWIARNSLHEDLPVYPRSWFPWAQVLEDHWRCIRKELDEILNRREDMPDFHQILTPVTTITQDRNWKTFFLIGPGMDCSENRKQCPETCRLIDQIPGIQTAMFSILSPGKHIPAHRGPYNGVLRYHLGLLVPEPSTQCRIRIAQNVYHWKEGESLIFDDTFNHEVWNDTEGYRVVLFVDFTRPMKPPYSRLNDFLLKIAGNTPFLREANANQKAWAKKFYKT